MKNRQGWTPVGVWIVILYAAVIIFRLVFLPQADHTPRPRAGDTPSRGR